MHIDEVDIALLDHIAAQTGNRVEQKQIFEILFDPSKVKIRQALRQDAIRNTLSFLFLTFFTIAILTSSGLDTYFVTTDGVSASFSVNRRVHGRRRAIQRTRWPDFHRGVVRLGQLDDINLACDEDVVGVDPGESDFFLVCNR